MKARVIAVNQRGVTVDEVGTIDGNPDRLVVKLKGIGCSAEAFIQKLISIDKEASFCAYREVKDTFCDIGGGAGSLAVNDYLVIEAGKVKVIKNL